MEFAIETIPDQNVKRLDPKWLRSAALFVAALILIMILLVIGQVWHAWTLATILLALFAAGLVFHQGNARRPTPPAFLTFDPNVNQAVNARFRIATYNIHSCIGADGRSDPARVAANLHNFDFVGLNEVRRGVPFENGDQSADLASKLGMQHYFAPTERRWGFDGFGNAILHRNNLMSVARINMPCSRNYKFRNIVVATVMLGGKPVTVFATHIDRRRDRAMQMAMVQSLFLNASGPAILMGDFNTPPDDAIMAPLVQHGDVKCVSVPLALADGAKCVDWIVVRHLKITGGGIVESDASDHPLVWAELEHLA